MGSEMCIRDSFMINTGKGSDSKGAAIKESEQKEVEPVIHSQAGNRPCPGRWPRNDLADMGQKRY